MKISASLYANENRPLRELVLELDECHIDYFHIDCHDDEDVFDDIAQIRKWSNTPIDMHLITGNPERFFPLLETHGIEYASFQYERLPKGIRLSESTGTQFGLAINSETPIDVFEDFHDTCDFVLIMTTEPGKSGGKFRKENFQKIRKFRNAFPGKYIHVDGGVNDETGFILRMLGVQAVVSGSYITHHQSVGTALLHLKSSIIHSDFQIRDFMIDKVDAPVLPSNAAVKDIFETIETFKLGFTLLENEDGSLFGLSSNADVRRGLLRHLDDLNRIRPEDIINHHPVCINQNSTISNLLYKVRSERFLVSYLPVIDDRNKLVGVLSFINLIRSES